MCGTNIVGGLLSEAVHESRRSQSGYVQQPAPQQPSVQQEVKVMYARGDIPSATYHRLMEMAQNGELSWADLERVRGEGGAVVEPAAKPASQPRDADIVRSLNRLYTHRSQLEAAQQESEQVLQQLEADAARLRQQAEEATTRAAQVADSDEATARAYLSTRQEALDRVHALEERITSLREDLSRIESLRHELATKEAELKALEKRSQLADLEASIREDLLV